MNNTFIFEVHRAAVARFNDDIPSYILETILNYEPEFLSPEELLKEILSDLNNPKNYGCKPDKQLQAAYLGLINLGDNATQKLNIANTCLGLFSKSSNFRIDFDLIKNVRFKIAFYNIISKMSAKEKSN